MKNLAFYIVDAFTDTAFKGNPAGVVLCTENLTKQTMQNIAKEINLSETAFLFKANDKPYHFLVNYFTPTSEVDFCGHATIGAAWIIANELHFYPKKPQLLLKTKIGIVPIDWQTKNKALDSVTMTQATPKAKRIIIDNLSEFSLALGLPEKAIDETYPIGLGYSGNWHLLVPIKDARAIDAATPNLEKLARFNKKQECITTHLYTFCQEQETGYRLYTRDFAPAIGIPEDPVTGSANGALCAFLIKEGILNPNKNHQFIIKQGNSLNREGYLFAEILKTKTSFTIKIGGQAVLTMSGTINR